MNNIFKDREAIMIQWDRWVKYYQEDGPHGSWPRDAFESLLDMHTDQINDLWDGIIDTIESLRKRDNLDNPHLSYLLAKRFVEVFGGDICKIKPGQLYDNTPRSAEPSDYEGEQTMTEDKITIKDLDNQTLPMAAVHLATLQMTQVSDSDLIALIIKARKYLDQQFDRASKE